MPVPGSGVTLFPQVRSMAGSPSWCLRRTQEVTIQVSRSLQVSRLVALAGYRTGYRRPAEPAQFRGGLTNVSRIIGVQLAQPGVVPPGWCADRDSPPHDWLAGGQQDRPASPVACDLS